MINNTIIGSGSGQLYCHSLSLSSDFADTTIFVTIINNSNVPFTKASLLQYLDNNGYKDTYGGVCLMASGKTTLVYNTIKSVSGIAVNNSNNTMFDLSAYDSNGGATIPSDDINVTRDNIVQIM